MILRCVSNRKSKLNVATRILVSRWSHDEYYEIEVGRDYPTYGLVFAYGLCFAMVDVDAVSAIGRGYPKQLPIAFFEVIDPVIPSNWAFSDYYDVVAGWMFFVWRREFVENKDLYGSMVDGESHAVNVWQQWRSESAANRFPSTPIDAE